MDLTKYEQDALREALEKHINLLDSQAKELSKIKHATSEQKKEIKREVEKKASLLRGILRKL